MLPSAQEEEVEVDEFPVDPDVSCCLLIKFYLLCSLNFVFFSFYRVKKEKLRRLARRSFNKQKNSRTCFQIATFSFLEKSQERYLCLLSGTSGTTVCIVHLLCVNTHLKQPKY